MNTLQNFTPIINPEGDGFVVLFPELDVASQGDTLEVSTVNLQEAIHLLLEVASKEEIESRIKKIL